MSTKPPTQRRPPELTDSSDLRWRPDEDDDDLFPDELPLDSDEAFEEALERALARNGLDRPSSARPQGNSVPPLGLGEADEDPFGRPSGRRAGSHIEKLAREVVEERASGGTGLLDEALDEHPLPAPPRRRRHSWGSLLLAGVAGILALAAILGIWRLSARLDQIEARLATPPPPSNGTAKVPATGAAPPQALSSISVREEFRTLTEQLRAQVTQDTLRLQGDLRDLAMRSEQRWQALEARRVATQPAPARTPTPAAPQVVANAAPPTAPPAAPKPVVPQASKPPPAKPAAGPWAIALASLADPAQAAQELARLRGLGLGVESHKVQTGGQTWHRISLDGFPTREAAEAYVTKAKGNPKLARAFADSRIAKR